MNSGTGLSYDENTVFRNTSGNTIIASYGDGMIYFRLMDIIIRKVLFGLVRQDILMAFQQDLQVAFRKDDLQQTNIYR